MDCHAQKLVRELCAWEEIDRPACGKKRRRRSGRRRRRRRARRKRREERTRGQDLKRREWEGEEMGEERENKE